MSAGRMPTEGDRAIDGLGAMANFLRLPYHPRWSVILIAVDLSVIRALSAGTRREADAITTT
ncbi:DUF7144 family membrane protein [Streptomyces sp. NPDC054945]